MSPGIYRNRLLKLADLLHNLPRKRFKYNAWGIGNPTLEAGTNLLSNPESCGTSACALGWAVALPFAKEAGFTLRTAAPYGFNIYADQPLSAEAAFFCYDKWVSPLKVARTLFGVSDDEFRFLFYPNRMCFISRLDETATPKRVARHIRNFADGKYVKGKYDDVYV